LGIEQKMGGNSVSKLAAIKCPARTNSAEEKRGHDSPFRWPGGYISVD